MLETALTKSANNKLQEKVKICSLEFVTGSHEQDVYFKWSIKTCFEKNWPVTGRFHEEVSDTSSSILSSHNSDDTYADASKTCLNGYSHHQNGCSNATIASANNANGNANGNGTRGTLYMNGNGSLHNGR